VHGHCPRCGLPVEAGILTGIIGGIVVGAAAGCPLQVSGPAAGLILVVSEIISDDLDNGLQILALSLVWPACSRSSRACFGSGSGSAPSARRHQGMMAGIGLTIVATQLPIMLDAGTPPPPPPAAVAAADRHRGRSCAEEKHDSKHKAHGSIGKLLALPTIVYHTVAPPEGSPAACPRCCSVCSRSA
jgi:hypothetical protein